MTPGKRLKYLRTQNSMTQKDLASRLSKAESTIAMWEGDKRQIDYDTLKSLASLFNVTIDYLLCKSDDRNPTTPTKEPNETLIALHGQTEGLSEEQLKQVISYVQFLKSQE